MRNYHLVCALFFTIRFWGRNLYSSCSNCPSFVVVLLSVEASDEVQLTENANWIPPSNSEQATRNFNEQTAEEPTVRNRKVPAYLIRLMSAVMELLPQLEGAGDDQVHPDARVDTLMPLTPSRLSHPPKGQHTRHFEHNRSDAVRSEFLGPGRRRAHDRARRV